MYQGQQSYNPRVYGRQASSTASVSGPNAGAYNNQPFIIQQNSNKETPKIRVVVRKRPIGIKETKNGDIDVLEVKNEKSLVVKELKLKVDLQKYWEYHNYNFDNCFSHEVNNPEIYATCVYPLIECFFNGSNTTCFAYGQTGSGKTYTMMGKAKDNVPGLYLLAARDIMASLKNFPEVYLAISFYEIYGVKLLDLLNEKKEVKCLEDDKKKINICGLTEVAVKSVQDIMQLIGDGLEQRSSGATGANDTSSRSHAVLQMELKRRRNHEIHARMSFIDLAGSERGADTTDNNKQTRTEGAEINKSLLALKECIRALDLEKKHLPFRGSQLTKVLRDSFTGNSRTTMIANVSPANSCTEHTLNTLRYADRVKEMKKDGGDATTYQRSGNKGDQMSRELMLARQTHNTKKIKVNKETSQTRQYNMVSQAQLAPVTHNNYFSDQNQGSMQERQGYHQITGNIRGQNMIDGGHQPQVQQPTNAIRIPPSNAPTGIQNMPKGNSFHFSGNNASSQQTIGQMGRHQQQQLHPAGGGLNFFQKTSQPSRRVTVGMQGHMTDQSQIPNNMQQPMNFYEKPKVKKSNSAMQHFEDSSTAHSNLHSAHMHQPQVPLPHKHPSTQMPFSVNSAPSQASSLTGGDYLLESTNRTKNFMNELITPQGLAQLQVTLGPLQGSANSFNANTNYQSVPIFMLLKGITNLPTMPSYAEMEHNYGTNLEQMYQDHNKLIGMILSEEEDLIECHKQHVNEIINIEKEEMSLISDVDKSGSDVESYIEKLDTMLQQKQNMISQLRKKLIGFNSHLQMEKSLQKLYNHKQSELDDDDSGNNTSQGYPIGDDFSTINNQNQMQQDSEGMIMGGTCPTSLSQQQQQHLMSKHHVNSVGQPLVGQVNQNNIISSLHGDNEDGDSDNIDDGEENLGFDQAQEK